MTDAAEEGAPSPDSESEPDQPPPRHLTKAVLLAAILSPCAIAQTSSPAERKSFLEPSDLPIGPATWLITGLVLTFLASLVGKALLKFSPALLMIRVEKKNGEAERATTDSQELQKELQDAEVYLAPIVLVKFTGLAIALLGGLALYDADVSAWPSGWPGLLALFLLAVLLGEMLPNRITDFRAELIVFRALPFLRTLRFLLRPLTFPLSKFSSVLVRNVLGLREELEQTQDREQLADEIRAAVEDSDESEALDDEEKEWIENIVEFQREDAAGIMTPRTDMVGVEARTSFRDAVNLAVEAGHSRLPVFEDKMDNIVGMFYLRDAVGLLTENASELLERPVSGYMRETYFVPESKKVRDLLHEFKSRRVQIAIVVDEYGGTAGLVSIEDILEEIVGDIEDEYDPQREDPLLILEDGKLAEIDAKVRIGDLNEALDIDVPESEDYETVGGFVFSHLGRIPRVGESFQYENIEIAVLGGDARRLSRLRVRVLESTGAHRRHTSPARPA